MWHRSHWILFHAGVDLLNWIRTIVKSIWHTFRRGKSLLACHYFRHCSQQWRIYQYMRQNQQNRIESNFIQSNGAPTEIRLHLNESEVWSVLPNIRIIDLFIYSKRIFQKILKYDEHRKIRQNQTQKNFENQTKIYHEFPWEKSSCLIELWILHEAQCVRFASQTVKDEM